jgi:hypothetical protein
VILLVTGCHSAHRSAAYKILTIGQRSTLAQRRWKWEARISINGHSIYLGRFFDEEDAARAYDQAGIEYLGLDNAYLNFPLLDYLEAA